MRILAALVYLFLYAPLAALVLFSFNAGRLASSWEGFTVAWYAQALSDERLQASLRNSLAVALATTAISTAIGTAAAMGLRRRVRGQAGWDALLALPILVPEVVLGASLVLLFAALGLRLGMTTVVLAHVAFSISYAVVVLRARVAALDPTLEEAAMDLGASPLRAFFAVTLPALAPGILAAALLVFALSIDDYVVTSFVAGVGATTLPVHIYSMVKSGISPAINAVSTLLLVSTSLLLLAAWALEQGARLRAAAAPAIAGLAILGAPFAMAPAHAAAGNRVLNVYIWSNYIAPETIRKFEERHGVRVNLDLYDTNEAMLAKVQSGNVDYDVLCPTSYSIQVLAAQGLLRPLDHTALPHLVNVDPAFLDRDYDRGNRYSSPYFWGTAGIAYHRSKVGSVDSWAALWDPKYRGRILMLDDAREGFGAALKRMGLSLNTTDPAVLARAREMLLAQKPLVRAYNASNYEDVLLSGDVWLAQGWNGQFARAIQQDPDIAYVIPREGSSLFIDSLVIPAGAPHPELAHAFIDFTLEAEIAAEICATMRYSTPNAAARALLAPELRANPAIFPPPDVLARAELMKDVGDATVTFDRLWTEVKSR
jgi:spermidine/putrescine transport system permease protein